MENPELIIVPVLAGVPAMLAVVFRWFKHRERMAPLAPPADPQQLAALEARLARMEQAIEAVAVEVERVSEGQRFVTRLLAERAPDGPAPANPRIRGQVTTPH
jgi:hypothetical protein